MNISNDDTALQPVNSQYYCKDRSEAVRFVEDCLSTLRPDRTWTIIIRPAKSVEYFVEIAIIESLEDTPIQVFYVEPQTT